MTWEIVFKCEVSSNVNIGDLLSGLPFPTCTLTMQHMKLESGASCLLTTQTRAFQEELPSPHRLCFSLEVGVRACMRQSGWAASSSHLPRQEPGAHLEHGASASVPPQAGLCPQLLRSHPKPGSDVRSLTHLGHHLTPP